jgi:hypothetical protein
MSDQKVDSLHMFSVDEQGGYLDPEIAKWTLPRNFEALGCLSQSINERGDFALSSYIPTDSSRD